MSGHSKWAQIKHKKATTDIKRAKLFSKLVREISIAAKLGGPSPDANPRLRAALLRARSAGLPKDTIERARAPKATNEQNILQEFLYEATFLKGIALLIEGITDSKNRTYAELKHLLNEQGGKFAEPGSLVWNFEKKGIIICTRASNPHKTKEEIETVIIESGADDFTFADEEWIIETEFNALETVRKFLEDAHILIQQIRHIYKPRMLLEISTEVFQSLEPLLDALTEHDDVQEVYTNIKN